MARHEQHWSDKVLVNRPPLKLGLAALREQLELCTSQRSQELLHEMMVAGMAIEGIEASYRPGQLEEHLLASSAAARVVELSRRIVDRAGVIGGTALDDAVQTIIATRNQGMSSQTRMIQGFREPGVLAIAICSGRPESAAFQSRSFIISREGIARVLRQGEIEVPDRALENIMTVPLVSVLNPQPTSVVQDQRLAVHLGSFADPRAEVLLQAA